jgi:glycerol-3-phosphate dehydrogenase
VPLQLTQMKSRTEALRTVEANSFDVCVIGGGATGSGCALDAQLRGLKTVLVEGTDFASGTSSASTKMVHGGVRYLEQAVRHVDLAEYKVVKRALDERVHMLRNAPFLTGVREFITPCYSWGEVAYFGTGLKLYDWIAGKTGLAPSRFLSRDEALRRIPVLNGEKLVGAVAYTDGQFDDARYNIALLLTFAEAGGEGLNYARVIGFERAQGGKIGAAEVQDRISARRFTVRAQAFLNATGPSADTIRSMAAPDAERRMRLSRGVHILLPAEVLSSCDALLIPKTEDGRVLFAIPWMSRLLVGTTDDEVQNAEQPGITAAEVEYLLRHLNRYLAKTVGPHQVVSGFAGVRPLVTSGQGKHIGKGRTKELARDHEVEVDPTSGLISIMGGKWTTYRAMAQDAIDAVERCLNRTPVPCRTLNYPLVGSDGFSAEYGQRLAAHVGISEATARHLVAKFGTRAAKVLALTQDQRDLAAPLVEGLAPLRAEVVFCARNEMAVSIEDILGRRIGLQFYAWREAMKAAPTVADLLAVELGWPTAVKQAAVEQYFKRMENLMRESGLRN